MDGIVLKKYINLKIQYFDSFKCSVFIKLIFAKFCRPLDFPGQLWFRLSELVFHFQEKDLHIWILKDRYKKNLSSPDKDD